MSSLLVLDMTPHSSKERFLAWQIVHILCVQYQIRNLKIIFEHFLEGRSMNKVTIQYITRTENPCYLDFKY